MAETELIQAFLSAFPRPPRGRVPLGAGDDCAVVRARGDLCVTTDELLDGVHFRLGPFTFEDVGHKALAVNLSDLAAMGAAPRWFLCAVALPPTFGVREVRALARGMARLARRSGSWLVGGNFTSASRLGLVITAAGEVPNGQALRRDRGRPGDLLYVSGELGGARLGLRRLEEGRRAGGAIRRQKRPEPRLGLGRLARGYARAAIDLSDGLGRDLGQLCEASGCGAKVALSALPLDPGVRWAMGDEAPLFAAAGGEDYELLLAVPKGRALAFERACARAGEQVTWIGRLVPGRAVRFVEPSGRERPPPAGFDHFDEKRAVWGENAPPGG